MTDDNLQSRLVIAPEHTATSVQALTAAYLLGIILPETRVRLHALDALRGLAALAVVLWHWQHFQLLGTHQLTWSNTAPPLDHSHQPFFWALSLFYSSGYIAVDLFFLISGFIFFWLYADRLGDRSLSVIDFWVLRITRLYPLHLVTLLVVAALELTFRRETGQFFIYGANDLSHFLRGLLFFQSNGAGASFNGPTWSITIELIMYGLFCAVAWFGLLRYALVPFVIFLLGLFIYSKHQNIAMGICGFFEGGLVYYLFLRVRNSVHRPKIFLMTMFACVAGWLAVLAGNYAPLMAHGDFARFILPVNGIALRLSVAYILFPLTILLLAMHETTATTTFRYRYLSWLGEISYSSYLLHFPLQLIFALAIMRGFLSLKTENSDVFLLVYGGILIALSLVVFRGFELPVQRKLRESWKRMVHLSSSSRKQPA